MIHPIEFEIYQDYRRLQEDYRYVRQQLHQQYRACRCFACKLQLILFTVELINLDVKIAHIEEWVSPDIGVVLTKMQIRHTITTEGIITLTD